MHPVLNHDGDGEGEELPSAKAYFEAGSKDYTTSMTVTDLSLCQRPAEHAICAAFHSLISAAAAPSLGTDVTDTRIGGAGYRTVFLARLEGVELTGADKAFVFLGGDSQDPPQSALAVYVYARRRTNLVQLTAAVGRCEAPAQPNESDAAYYRRVCLGERVLARAKAVGLKLVSRFRLAHPDR